MAEASTLVYDASDKILGSLASHVAKRADDRSQGWPTASASSSYNAEKAVVTGPKTARSSPITIRSTNSITRGRDHSIRGMPDQILKRTVRGMLPYQKNSSGRNSLRDLRVMIGKLQRTSLEMVCPMVTRGVTRHHIDRDLPQKFVRLGEISASSWRRFSQMGR